LTNEVIPALTKKALSIVEQSSMAKTITSGITDIADAATDLSGTATKLSNTASAVSTMYPTADIQSAVSAGAAGAPASAGAPAATGGANTTRTPLNTLLGF
jgi:hypothetical protein